MGGVCGGTGSGRRDVSLAQATGVYSIDSSLVLCECSVVSAMAISAVGSFVVPSGPVGRDQNR